MPIKMIPPLLMLMSLLISCEQKISVSLQEDRNQRVYGMVKGDLALKPVFARYLKNLDMFSGLELPEQQVPTTITNSLLPYKDHQTNYWEKPTYNTKNKSYDLEFGFEFADIAKLTESDIRNIISDVVFIEKEPNKTTLRIEFNEKNRLLFEQFLPLLLPMPIQKNKDTKAVYLKELAKIVSESERQTGPAEKEIDLSKVTINITTPRPIRIISGGKIINDARTQAQIQINLVEIIYLEKNQLYLITY